MFGKLFFFGRRGRGGVGCDVSRGDKISPNLFAHSNSLTLIESKFTQLLVGLNEHQPN